jgi:integrase
MAKAEIGYVSVTAKGKRYNYAWRGGPRLLEKPDTPEFLRELNDRLAERKAGDRRKISGLCAAYRASDAWTDLADKTRTNWAPWLDKIQSHFGCLTIATFDRPLIRPAIRAWRDKYKATPRSADVGLQVLSRLLSFAAEEGLLATNATTDVPRLYRNDRSSVIWTDADLKELAKHASPEIMWAARLAAMTGLRQGDLLRLSWSHIRENAIEIRTRKTGSTAEVPLYDDLRALLAEIPKRATTVLTSTKKRPWGSGFGASWQDAIKAAGIDKHFHDLRGTAATRLYLADFTLREIAQVLGWSEDRVEALLDRYVKKDELLKDRIRRLSRNEDGTPFAKPGAKPSS